MKIPYGELAALGTALCWTVSSLAFTAAARRMGSLALNLIRLVIALAFLTLACAAVLTHASRLERATTRRVLTTSGTEKLANGRSGTYRLSPAR